VVINAAESIQLAVADNNIAPQLTALQTEARRINHDLMHLLGLNKMDRSSYAICPEIVDCEELIEELGAYNEPLLKLRGIRFEADPGESVEGYFDRDLVIGILNSVINNAQRFARETVRVVCNIDDGYTVISVDDDGDGYP
jgi:signal transduction histidine kinase